MNLNLVVFFGGILLGFFFGFTLMAVLAASSLQNHFQELAEAIIDRRENQPERCPK